MKNELIGTRRTREGNKNKERKWGKSWRRRWEINGGYDSEKVWLLL